MADGVATQWAECNRNIGAWEGSLSRFKPDGTLGERTPTVLFIYTSTKDDTDRVAAGGVPYRLDVMLRQAEKQTDAKQMYFQGVDLAQSGTVYGPGGWLCSGQTAASTVGALYVEQNINAVADGAGGAGPLPPPGAAAPTIVGRVRLVTVYTAECHLRGLSLFRERRSGLVPGLPHPTVVPAEAAATDFPAAAALGSTEATPASLVGTWAGTAVAVGAAGATSAATAYTLTVGLDGSALTLTTAGDDTGGGVGGGGSPPSRTGTVTPGGQMALLAGGGESGTPTHLLFLGGGVTVLLPGVRPAGAPFGVELGWLTGVDSRLRIVRRYGGDGRWVGSTFLRERRGG
eukprot:TRINITY_DN5881_c0_g1_i1.p1 TRINITY_DN5881_c0_g1~~TRINITY_DN5881_c0_g1_i1.p1  ORF type:complete len:372 (+),score=106.68 TRINITY_DN5881_c0_g1_i1:83-1117(+)